MHMHDSFEYDKNTVYDEFKEQLVRDKKGCYERGLLWSGAHPVLPSYKQESIPASSAETKQLGRQGLTNEYDQIIGEN